MNVRNCDITVIVRNCDISVNEGNCDITVNERNCDVTVIVRSCGITVQQSPPHTAFLTDSIEWSDDLVELVFLVLVMAAPQSTVADLVLP